MISAVALMAGQQVAGQGPAQASAAHLEAMKKLSFLAGEWKGEGWTEFVPGQRRTSPIVENVQPRLGGAVLLVEGLGKKKVPASRKRGLRITRSGSYLMTRKRSSIAFALTLPTA